MEFEEIFETLDTLRRENEQLKHECAAVRCLNSALIGIVREIVKEG